MAIKTPEELRSSLTAILGDSPSDDGVTLMEDMADTLASLTGRGTAADWEQKYNENDAAWRKRYMDRFGEPVKDDPNANNGTKNKNTNLSFESLFKEE